MKTQKLIRSRICPNVNAPDDSLEGAWRGAYRRANGTRTAFHARGRWWGVPWDDKGTVDGPHESRDAALDYREVA